MLVDQSIILVDQSSYLAPLPLFTHNDLLVLSLEFLLIFGDNILETHDLNSVPTHSSIQLFNLVKLSSLPIMLLTLHLVLKLLNLLVHEVYVGLVQGELGIRVNELFLHSFDRVVPLVYDQLHLRNDLLSLTGDFPLLSL